MKYVIIADLHCKLTNYSLTVNGIPEHLYYPLLNLRNAATLAKNNDAILLVAGDVIDSKILIHQQVISEVSEAIQEVSKEVESYWLLGNHDYHILNDKLYSYLTTFDIQLATPNNPIVRDEFALVAYSKPETIVDDIRNCDIERIKLLVSHFGIQEAEMSSSNYRQGEFRLKDLEQLKHLWLILGHYHKPQKVSDNVYYVGSPIPTRISEVGEEKRMLLLDTDTNTIQSILTEYPKIIEMTLKEDDKVNEKSISDDIINNFSKYILNIPTGYNDIIKLTKLVKEFRGYIFIKIYDLNTVVESTNKEIDIDKLTLNDIFEEFMKTKTDYNQSIKNKYIQIANKINSVGGTN